MTDDLAARSLAAQQSVIGAMLIKESCIPSVLAQLQPEDFIDGACRNTYRAIRNLSLEGKPVDVTILTDAVGGGDAYIRWLREVVDNTVTAANVESYAEIVRKSATLHRLQEFAGNLLACWNLDEAAGLVRKMSAALSATSRMPHMTAAELAQDFLSRMSSKEKPKYLPWGIPKADKIVYAELGDVILLGGYPSAGKTLLSLQMALAQAKRYRVGYYTLETQPEKMADRMFSHLTKVPLSKIKTRDFSQSDWNRFAEETSNFVSKCPIDFIRAAGSTVDDICADAVAHRFQIIYVDYLQLVEAPGIRAGDRYAAVSSVSRSFKIFAQNHNIAVVELAQLARPETMVTGPNKVKTTVAPTMHSFRESGQTEQDADVAFLLWATDPNNNRSRRAFKIGKNKEGERGSVELTFDGSIQTMAEVATEPHQVTFRELRASEDVPEQFKPDF